MRWRSIARWSSGIVELSRSTPCNDTFPLVSTAGLAVVDPAPEPSKRAAATMAAAWPGIRMGNLRRVIFVGEPRPLRPAIQDLLSTPDISCLDSVVAYTAERRYRRRYPSGR